MKRRTRKRLTQGSKQDYYNTIAENYKPLEIWNSKAMEIIRLNGIKMSEPQGGGEAIRKCLQFMLQNQVTEKNFEDMYETSLKYILHSTITGKVHYKDGKGTYIKTKADVEQLMRENLRASGVYLKVKEFIKINTIY